MIYQIVKLDHPGKRSDGKQMLYIVKRLADRLHAQQPETLIILRGDSRHAFPEVMNFGIERPRIRKALPHANEQLKLISC